MRFIGEMADVSFATIDQYAALLARLPPGLDVSKLAHETKAFLRPRGIHSAADLLRLILAWAGERGIADLTEEALLQRVHGSATFMQAMTEVAVEIRGRQSVPRLAGLATSLPEAGFPAAEILAVWSMTVSS